MKKIAIFLLFFVMLFLTELFQPDFILNPDGSSSNAWGQVSGPGLDEDDGWDHIEDDGEDEDLDPDWNWDFPSGDWPGWPWWPGPPRNSQPGEDDHGASDGDERE
ncbi:MAG TPA: hypothetical protein ENH12_00980 [Proteobacteria bacterium]|nr:hypothetical protein [Pseudomonadota bacterium]